MDSGSSGNKAYAQQGDITAQEAQDNKLEISQNGDDNQARTEQRFDNNEALTDQTGTDNYADIYQYAQPDQSDGHTAEVTQNGGLNDAWVRQDGVGARNAATSRQDGTDNYSDQVQWSTDNTDFADSNNAAVFQGTNGGNLMTTVIDSYMDTFVDNYHVGGNSASIRNSAFQDQYGDDNDAAAFQRGQDNYSEQKQVGDENDALVIQNFYDPNGANGNNYAKQTQTGDYNIAGIAQNGYNNRALQSQNGDYNIALSTQQGHDNDANVHQIGDDNYATTAQRASCNDILVVQYDGQSAVVEQNLDGLPGGNNTANIYQSGPDGGGGTINCAFDPKLTPRTRVDIPVFNIPDVCPGC
ncbi:hypothetical protein [Aequorivita capsosiphonis]|uniref:hypothetical protein n=1 Tax=Aequorivita capsosiphonis TaxID=487317 RepID=UPI001FE12FFE|nr:hypothetical protein [Aequorivita capsosiphonis]